MNDLFKNHNSEPESLNQRFENFIKNPKFSKFSFAKKELSKKTTNSDWFLKLKELAKQNNIRLWNEFIKYHNDSHSTLEIKFENQLFEQGKCDFSNLIFCKTTFRQASFQDEANFKNTTFQNTIVFQETNFEKNVDFEKAKFKNFANFRKIKIEGEFYFEESDFKDNIDFSYGKIKNKFIFTKKPVLGKATFSETKFESTVDFSEAKFEGMTFFKKAEFNGYTSFEHAIFCEYTSFAETKFKNFIWQENEYLNFKNVVFKKLANFEFAEFKQPAEFKDTRFIGDTYFNDTNFKVGEYGTIDFSKAKFKGNVTFAAFKTDKSASSDLCFRKTLFTKEVDFRRRNFTSDISFNGAKFTNYLPKFSAEKEYNLNYLDFYKIKLPNPKECLSENPKKLLIILEKIAHQNYEDDLEIKLFILRRKLTKFIPRKILIFLYWVFADYGRSAFRPFIWWVSSILGLSVILSCESKYKFDFCDALIVVFNNAIPFVNMFAEKTQSISNNYFRIQEISKLYIWIFSIHSIFSIVMIFLFSLAIRNYLRIR